MNSLSWMIYAADVVQGLQAILAVCAAVGMTAHGIGTLMQESPDGRDITPPKWLLPASILSLFLSAAIPSRHTVYMIAASEVASRSETLAKAGALADPAIDLIRKKIDDALKAK